MNNIAISISIGLMIIVIITTIYLIINRIKKKRENDKIRHNN